jgi:hypothetical protein
MRVDIYSKSQINDESCAETMRFDTVRFDADKPRIKLEMTPPAGDDAPSWHIDLRGECLQKTGSDETDDSADYRLISRELFVRLTPADVSQLLKLAIAHNLVALSVTQPVSADLRSVSTSQARKREAA